MMCYPLEKNDGSLARHWGIRCSTRNNEKKSFISLEELIGSSGKLVYFYIDYYDILIYISSVYKEYSRPWTIPVPGTTTDISCRPCCVRFARVLSETQSTIHPQL